MSRISRRWYNPALTPTCGRSPALSARRISVRPSPSTEDDLMKRFAGVAAVCLVAILGADVSTARAQSVPAEKMYGEFNFGPTLGHQSSGFLGADFGYRVMPGLDIVAEVSHMFNVGTSDLDNRATIIANAIGGTSSSAFKVTEFAAGARYRIPIDSKFEPYVIAEFGVAHVRTEVAFAVNGQ